MSLKTPKTLTGMMARAVGMKIHVPKTGLAARMREWMSKQRKPFTAGMVADALSIPPGAARDRVRNAIPDFIRRAEIFPVATPKRLGSDKQKRRQTFYACNPAWHRIHKGTLNKRIYKAMYVSGTFTLSDIQRLSEAPERNWLDKIFPLLRKKGLIRAVGRRACAHGAGSEIIYHISVRDRFRLEVMK